MPRPVAAALLSGVLLCPGGASANRPLNADTADTLVPARCQFEPYTGRSSADEAPAQRFWVLQVNCGVASRSQFGVSWAGSADDGAVERRFGLAGKTALRALTDGQTGLAVGYSVSAARPSGGSWTGEGAALYGIASREWTEGWLTHANFGWSRSRSAHQSSTTWALATEYAVRDGVVLSAEAYGDDRTRPWISVGALWQLQPGASVNASYGVQRESPRVQQWTIGFLIEF